MGINFICMQPSWTCFNLWHQWHGSCQLAQFLEYGLNLNPLRQLTTVHCIHTFYWLQPVVHLMFSALLTAAAVCISCSVLLTQKRSFFSPHQTPVSFPLCMQRSLDWNTPTAAVPPHTLGRGVCSTRSALCCQVFFPSGLTVALVCLLLS